MSPTLAALGALLITVQAAGEAQAPGADQQPAVPVPVAAPTPEPTPTPEARHVPPEASLEELWSQYVASEAAGDAGEAGRRLHDIRRLKVERNIENLETVGLGLVARGVARMDEGEGDLAAASFERAIQLAPGLPDGHYGLAVSELKKGPLGLVPSVQAMASGLVAFLPTARGELRSAELLVVASLLAVFLMTWAVALALLFRAGGLLRHDIEEWLGPRQSRAASLALLLLILLLPLAAFQGWGWLPLWWLAVLFSYFSRTEKMVTAVAFVALIVSGPALDALSVRAETARNPLFRAAIAAVDGKPDAHDARLLEAAARRDPEDRDMLYLLASAWRRSGRLQEATDLYSRMLSQNPGDSVASNNLANLEFARGQHEAALGRYRDGSKAGGSNEVAAVFFYNLSLAHLQKFEYQAYNEAKSSADRLTPGGVGGYDRWKYDSGDYAVVDLGLTREDVWRKFAGVADGVGERNVMGSGGGGSLGFEVSALLNRFTVAAALFGIVAFLIGRVRGSKAFTVRCSRCGMPFCRKCHLGQVVGDLCSQCYHLFVIRDGVSGPVRNRKMGEVQDREARRNRLFRALSILSPGTGHIYARQTMAGVAMVITWYVILAAAVSSAFVPLTEVSSRLRPPWAITLAVLLLISVWVLANRIKPDFEVPLPKRRQSRRSGRAR